MEDTKVICFAGLKGGVGKTSQTLSVAYCASNEYDKKVLVIDMDSQSSASIITGETPNSYDARTPNKDIVQLLKEVENEDLSYEVEDLRQAAAEEPEWNTVYGIHTLLDMVINGKSNQIDKELLDKCIHHPSYYLMQAKRDGAEWVKNEDGKVIYEKSWYEFGFDIMPSTEELSDIQFDIASMSAKERGVVLELIIRKIKKYYDYDYIMIDCPPAIDFLTANSFFSANSGVIITVSQDKQSLYALSRIKENIRTVARFRKDHNGALGIVLTIFNKKRITDRYIALTVGHDTRLRVFKTKITETSDAKKAILCGLILPQVNKKNYEENCKLFKEIDKQIEILNKEREGK